jgi:hypothetical protein
MRRAALLLALWLASGAAFAQDAAPPGAAEGAAIRAVIAQQLAAFGRDDGAAAFAFASPGIQARFGTPERFMAMVRSGYAPVYRPRETEFRGLAAGPEGPVQQVLFVGPDGRPVLALYTMEREADGSWRIAGCRLVALEERTS